MIVGLIVSAFNAYIYKDQDILISLIATLQRIGFLVFLFLCNSTLTLKDIEKVVTTQHPYRKLLVNKA